MVNYLLSILALCIVVSAEAAEPRCEITFGKLERLLKQRSNEKEIEKIVLQEIDGNFYQLDPTLENAKIWNEELLKKLEELPFSGPERDRLKGLSRTELDALYLKASTNPVADYANVKRYDPKGNIGFCFGRAMNVHLEALRAGVAQENVKKVWAVGTMKANNILWQHHVATMVRGEDKLWYVLDPEYNKVLSLRDWMKEVKQMDTNGKLMFYATDAGRWGVYDSSGYLASTLKDPFYNNYFEDLLKLSREEASNLAKERSGRR